MLPVKSFTCGSSYDGNAIRYSLFKRRELFTRIHYINSMDG
jgi:hypothetical protein